MRKNIIRELINSKDNFVSGQFISEKYNITRAGVSKIIKKLREDGYQIESITNKGYRLLMKSDTLEMAYLDFDESWILGKEYFYFDKIDSTSIYAKKIAADQPEGTIIISEKQTNGKGRLGRSWDSEYKSGIWMSIILKPNILPSEASIMTQVAAAAIVNALNKTCDCDAKIKWPNDIVCGDKKICGILTEMSGEIDHLNYVVLGIGVNVNQKQEEISQEISFKATSISQYLGRDISRDVVLQAILAELDYFYRKFISGKCLNEIIEICKYNSATLGKNVKVIKDNEIIEGKAMDIDSMGQLIIQDNHDKEIKIISGEVSVRGLYGYI